MTEFACADLKIGQLNAVVKKLGGEQGVLRFLRGELEVKELVVPNIDLAKAYELLGMQAEYEKALGKGITEDTNLWQLLVVEGLTCKKLVEAYKKAGVQMYLYTEELDEDVVENQRDPNRDCTYLLGFKRTVEADEDNKNQSADQRKEKKCEDITLMERLLLGLAYFLATGQHLDVKNYTLCTGSRHRDGNVPYVNWSSDARRVYVHWYYPDGRYDCLRARSVVSVAAKQRESVA